MKVNGLCLTCGSTATCHQQITRAPLGSYHSAQKFPSDRSPFTADSAWGNWWGINYLFCCPDFVWPETFLESQWKQNIEKGSSPLVLQIGKRPTCLGFVASETVIHIHPLQRQSSRASDETKADLPSTTSPCILKANKVHRCSVQHPKYKKKQCL